MLLDCKRSTVPKLEVYCSYQFLDSRDGAVMNNGLHGCGLAYGYRRQGGKCCFHLFMLKFPSLNLSTTCLCNLPASSALLLSF
jgi:hypothetical protein